MKIVECVKIKDDYHISISYGWFKKKTMKFYCFGGTDLYEESGRSVGPLNYMDHTYDTSFDIKAVMMIKRYIEDQYRQKETKRMKRIIETKLKGAGIMNVVDRISETHWIKDPSQTIKLSKIPLKKYQIKVEKVLDSECCDFETGELKIKPLYEYEYIITYWYDTGKEH